MKFSDSQLRSLEHVANAALLAYLQIRDGNKNEAEETLEDAWQYASNHLKQFFEVLNDE